jgi:hypothetical protein
MVRREGVFGSGATYRYTEDIIQWDESLIECDPGALCVNKNRAQIGLPQYRLASEFERLVGLEGVGRPLQPSGVNDTDVIEHGVWCG